MLQNSLKVALRNLLRQPGYTAINVVGLAIGMACCVFIALYMRTELSYEDFLKDSDRVHRLSLDVRIQNQEIQTAYTARPLGPALATDFPEVEYATRLWFDPTGDMVVRHGQNTFPEDRVFYAEQVVVLEGAEVMGRQSEAFRESLRSMPGITRVTNSEQVPGRFFNGSSFKIEGEPDESAVLLDFTYASYDFVETLGLEVVAGRSMSRDYASDSLSVMLNEAAVKQLGLTNPVGQRLEWTNESIYQIIGVVKDFHICSLHRTISPLALLGPDPRNTNRPNLLVAARIQTRDLPATLQAIESEWHTFAPQAPFVYSFIDDKFASLYEAERRTSKLITIFAGLAILIACIGLFGLSAYTVERRKKEIGLRKVLGASAGSIVRLLSKDFAVLVGMGIIIALPVAYLLMNRWVEDFAYSIELGPMLFFVAGVIVLGIAVVTVGSQSILAANINPAMILHRE